LINSTAVHFTHRPGAYKANYLHITWMFEVVCERFCGCNALSVAARIGASLVVGGCARKATLSDGVFLSQNNNKKTSASCAHAVFAGVRRSYRVRRVKPIPHRRIAFSRTYRAARPLFQLL